MTFGRLSVEDGMTVVDPDMVEIGQVQQRLESDFVVSRPQAGAVVVPYDMIQAIMGSRVVIKVHAADVHTLPAARTA